MLHKCSEFYWYNISQISCILNTCLLLVYVYVRKNKWLNLYRPVPVTLQSKNVQYSILFVYILYDCCKENILREFLSDHWSQTASGTVNTWMSDRLGTPYVVDITL